MRARRPLHEGSAGCPALSCLQKEENSAFQQFVDLALALYYKMDQALQELTDELAIAYKRRQEAGSQLRDTPASIGGMKVEMFKK